MLRFDSDYMEGAHPRILQRLSDINFEHHTGYGCDEISESARQKIRQACRAPDAEVYFLAGGTMTNAVLISSVLRSWQGVAAAETAHIATHEAGAVEYTGHKVLTLPSHSGRLEAADLEHLMERFEGDANKGHEVEPALVYISQPTELGTLYSLRQLKALRGVCDRHGLKLYCDGARLGYGLASPEADFTLADLAEVCDAFCIGGTKCGALFGEALVMKPGLVPRFSTVIKQKLALLAKGFVAGAQFDALFSDGLYTAICRHAVELALRLRDGLAAKGVEIYLDSPTNQQFFLLTDAQVEALRDRVGFSFWEKVDEDHTAIRLVTSWATRAEDVEALLSLF